MIFHGAADSDGRDDLDDVLDCGGEPKNDGFDIPHSMALLGLMAETTWTIRRIAKGEPKADSDGQDDCIRGTGTLDTNRRGRTRYWRFITCRIRWRCWQWWPWRLGRYAGLRDDLNDTPDCEGGTQSWQWWPRWLHQRHWNPRYQPSWPDQILTVHHMPHSMALLTLMAETTWTVCRIARENLKLTVMADTNRRGRNRNPRVSRGSVQSKHAKSTETATIWLTGSNCGRINYSIAWCVRSIVFRWLNTLEIMIRMLTRCGYCGYCEGASIWWWISRFTVMWHGRIVSRVVSKNLWEPNESGASSSPTSGLFGRRAF